jgi:hypothetical protein
MTVAMPIAMSVLRDVLSYFMDHSAVNLLVNLSHTGYDYNIAHVGTPMFPIYS